MAANELPSLDVLRRLFWMRGSELCWRSNDGVPAKGRGKVAGCLKRDGRTPYRIVSIDGVLYLTHRIAYALQAGVLPDTGLFIDHIDGDGLNNVLENLRLVDHQTNAKNARMGKNNTSGVNGVHLDKAGCKWKASVKVDGKSKHLGLFAWKDSAIAVRELANFIYDFSDRHGQAA